MLLIPSRPVRRSDPDRLDFPPAFRERAPVMLFRNWRGTWLSNKARTNRKPKTAPRRNYALRVEGLEERRLLDAGCVAPPPGLVSWWTGDDTFADLVGENDGVAQGVVGFAPGMVGQAFSFTGDGFVTVADNPTLDFTTGLTIEFWFSYTNADDFRGLIAKRSDGIANFGINVRSDFGLGLYFNDPNVANVGDDGGTFEVLRAPLPLPTANEFHHFAGTYEQTADGVRLSIYIDGVLVDQAVLAGNLTAALNDTPVTIGASTPDGTERFLGLLDEVSLYNRPLTAAEILSIFEAGSEGKCKTATAVDDAATTDEDTPVTIDALANDISPLGDPFAPEVVTGPANGEIVLNPDGTFSYTPDADFFGADSFTYKASPESNIATVSITINAVNDAPVLDPIGDQAADEGGTLTFTATASDVDSANLVFSLDSAPEGASITAAGLFTFSHADGPASFQVTVRVSDGGDPELSDTETFTISVNNVAPSVDTGDDEVLKPGGTLTRHGSFTDPGADTWTGTVNFGDDSGDQVLTLNEDGTFLLEHHYHGPGEFLVTVTVTDDDGGVGTDSFLVRVVPPGQLDSITINDGGDQRSMVNRLTISFSTIVELQQGAIKVKNRDNGTLVDLEISSAIEDGRTVTVVTFEGCGIVGGSLKDGNYKLIIDGCKILDQSRQAIDADNDGVAGGESITKFFRRFGDANGDHEVNCKDAELFFAAYGSEGGDPDYVWYFDYNANGRIGLVDLLQFLRRLF
jgi:hypothetical protein